MSETKLTASCVVEQLRRACEIIETGDQRLLASDGPAGGRPPDISLDEWRELYLCVKGARNALLESIRDRP